MRKQTQYCKKCWPKRKEAGEDVGPIVLYVNAACVLNDNIGRVNKSERDDDEYNYCALRADLLK